MATDEKVLIALGVITLLLYVVNNVVNNYKNDKRWKQLSNKPESQLTYAEKKWLDWYYCPDRVK